MPSPIDTLLNQATGTVFPAATLQVMHRNELVLQRATGWLDPETRQRPTKIDSLFDLASLTKLFTATAFMTFVEDGMLTLHTPVTAVLPELSGRHPISPSMDPLTRAIIPPDPRWAGLVIDADEITFFHLLTHTSGLAAWRPLFELDDDETPPPLPDQIDSQLRARRIAQIWDGTSFFYPPGERLIYSDLGLILLGETTARLTRRPLEPAVCYRAIDLLGMLNTTYNPRAHDVDLSNIAPTEFCSWRGRRCIGEVHDENAAGLGGVAGHAGLFGTVMDVVTLGQFFLNNGAWNGVRIFTPETVAQMTREQIKMDGLARGLGWQHKSADGGPVCPACSAKSYGHTGFTGTSLWIDPEHELVVSLLTNRVYGGRDPEGIAIFRRQLHAAIINSL